MVKYINFSQITYDDFTRFSILQIMYENYYHAQLAKISTCVKYSGDAYDRYILSFCFGNLNSRDYHGDSLNGMFPRFPTVSPGVSACFAQCFYGFLRCFSFFPAVFALFPILDFAKNLASPQIFYKCVVFYSDCWDRV